MTAQLVEDLRGVAAELTTLVEEGREQTFKDSLDALERAAHQVARAWSGSNLGYHSRIYYQDLSPVPADAHFSPEFGFDGYMGSTGEWQLCDYDKVIERIHELAGGVTSEPFTAQGEAAQKRLLRAKETVASILTTYLAAKPDQYIAEVQEKVSKITARNLTMFVRAQLPQGKIGTRDYAAAEQGIQVAPHQQILGEIVWLRAPYISAEHLAEYAQHAADHIKRFDATFPTVTVSQPGQNVFIGHGRSPLWRELKDYVQDNLGLPVDEFNKVETAGIMTVARLIEMLDNAALAFLVMTAEDETADGKKTARANVIHEVGLFQGRLGFDKAIILLEEGCEDFSNVNGLTQLRFPPGNISAVFHKVQDVLKREGLL